MSLRERLVTRFLQSLRCGQVLSACVDKTSRLRPLELGWFLSRLTRGLLSSSEHVLLKKCRGCFLLFFFLQQELGSQVGSESLRELITSCPDPCRDALDHVERHKFMFLSMDSIHVVNHINKLNKLRVSLRAAFHS